ncbi:MAG: hypothetical protein CM15mP116_06500 [Synechococcus sp.]|nr:MAG: hypothetical protein CM15mP116_06500 [Synechococcus sp.]
MAPAALPAGGADRRQPQPRRRAASGPLHTSSDQPLRLSPLAVAPRLRTLKAGSSLRLLRRWSTADGQDWLHVKTPFPRETTPWFSAPGGGFWGGFGGDPGAGCPEGGNLFQPMVPKSTGAFSLGNVGGLFCPLVGV